MSFQNAVQERSAPVQDLEIGLENGLDLDHETEIPELTEKGLVPGIENNAMRRTGNPVDLGLNPAAEARMNCRLKKRTKSEHRLVWHLLNNFCVWKKNISIKCVCFYLSVCFFHLSLQTPHDVDWPVNLPTTPCK